MSGIIARPGTDLKHNDPNQIPGSVPYGTVSKELENLRNNVRNKVDHAEQKLHDAKSDVKSTWRSAKNSAEDAADSAANKAEASSRTPSPAGAPPSPQQKIRPTRPQPKPSLDGSPPRTRLTRLPRGEEQLVLHQVGCRTEG